MSDHSQTEMRETLVKRATEAGWATFYDGVPCVAEAKEFAQAVKEAMPNVKFLPIDTDYVSYAVNDDAGVYQTTKNVRVYCEFAVYLDDYPLDLGRINFRDNGARKKDTYTYGIYSRKIANAKYAYHRDQHHMVTATDVKKAMKKVSQYFIPFSTKELAQAFYEPLKNDVAKLGNTLEREMRTKADPIVHNHHELLQEIYWLKQRGVEFSSPKFRDIAENVEDIITRYEAEQNRSIGAIFVRFYEIGGETYFSTQGAIEIKKHHDQLQGTEEWKIEGKPVEEMPEDIKGAVAVLSILNNGQYVASVGVKVDAKHFWIERG
jgi:hypothetical protein